MFKLFIVIKKFNLLVFEKNNNLKTQFIYLLHKIHTGHKTESNIFPTFFLKTLSFFINYFPIE